MTDLNLLRARQEALETANETLHEAFRTVDGDAHTALEIAKQNVKLMTVLRATQLEHGLAIAGLVVDVGEMKTEMAEVKAEVAGVKAEVAEVKAEVAEVKAEVAEVKAEVKAGLTEVLRRLPE